MKNLFGKEEVHIDDTVADHVLDNILSASGLPPNTVPLSTLRDQGNYKRSKFGLQKVITILLFLTILSLPLFVLHPRLAVVDETSRTSGSSLLYRARVEALMPISNVTASLDGIPLSIIETGKHEYAIQPTTNGTLKVTATLASGQSTSQEITVTATDTTAPKITNHSLTEDTLILSIKDDNSGVDWGGIVAMNEDGSTILPESYDEETGTVTFSYPTQSLNIYVKDYSGNTLQTIITVK